MDMLFLLRNNNLWVHTKNPKELFGHPAPRLPETSERCVLVQVCRWKEKGSRDLFFPMETRDAEQ